MERKRVQKSPVYLDAEVPVLNLTLEAFALMDFIPLPVFVIDSSREIVVRNKRSLRPDFSGLRTERFELKDPAEDAAFGVFLDTMFATADSQEARFTFRHGKDPCEILCFHNGSVADFLASEEHMRALLVWRPAEVIRPVDGDHCELSLSPVERRLVSCIVAGQTVREASLVLNVSYHTARKYLQNIFIKTGAKRQTELVALVSEASRLRSQIPQFVEQERIVSSRASA